MTEAEGQNSASAPHILEILRKKRMEQIRETLSGNFIITRVPPPARGATVRRVIRDN